MLLNTCSCCGGTRHVSDRGPNTAWHRARKLEEQYATRLRKIARHIADIVSAFDPQNWHSNLWLSTALRRYAETLEPWAQAVGERMITEVGARDLAAWRTASEKIGKQLSAEIHKTPVGQVMRSRLAEQVTLIKSIPLDAAERVHALTLQGIAEGTRAKDISAEIMRQGDVSTSRANLIARTEVARTATALTHARAQFVGSTHFIWRTAGDGRVREDHRILNGKVFAWADPPVADERTGERALPGAIYNCRCIPIPIFDDD